MNTLKVYYKERLIIEKGIESQLKSIATGFNSPPQCNIHKAFDVGNKLLTQLHRSNPTTVVIKNVDLCIQMTARAAL